MGSLVQRFRPFLRSGLLFLLISASSPAHAATYYVDCAGGADTNTGNSEFKPWQTLTRVNGTTFHGGDAILIRRGTICEGMLTPQGSGLPGQPIIIGAYGEGALPVIRGGANPAAVKLFNQQYWDIQNLEAVGGSPYGIFIGGSKGELHHFRIKDVVVHDVVGEPKTKESGLIVITGSGGSATMHDVVIDGATVYNTTQWAGIIVVGQQWSDTSPDPRGGSDFVVRNCVVHDVAGDAILITTLKHGLIERNASWNSGMQPTETIGTPDAMWAWMCNDCVVQYNEGYLSDSPGVDGGVFDIDYGNIDSIVQYNYAHDSQGYCASVFGSAGPVGNSINSEVRYNLCVNNGRSSRLAKRQGAIYVSTWNDGVLDGVKIHHNTIYWNPPGRFSALVSDANATGNRPNLFENNLIVSTAPDFGAPNSFLKLDGNLYWYLGAGHPAWTYDGKNYSGWKAYQTASGQDTHSIYADPKLTANFHLEPGSIALGAGVSPDQCAMDIFDNAPSGSSCPIGAAGVAFPTDHQASRDGNLPVSRGQWSLLSFLDIRASSDLLSRSQVVVFESMLNQYASKGLNIIITTEPIPELIENRSHEWHMENIQVVTDPELKLLKSRAVSVRPTTLLISPDGRELSRWDGFASAAEIGLTLRSLLGAPSGMAEIRGIGNQGRH